MVDQKKKPDFTKNQKQAIKHNNHNILVSASAGSGKTTVLVERVIQKLLANENKTSISELLIVTFTQAAANEMLERLEAALNQALENEEQSSLRYSELQTQLEMLPTANISTLHSYALRLIENYYHVIDLDPKFRLLGDEIETNMMKNDVLDQLFEELYDESLHDENSSIDFPYLVELFSKDRNDEGLRDVVMQLFNFANARPDFNLWLDQQASYFSDFDIEFTKSNLYKKHLQKTLQKEVKIISSDLNQSVLLLENFVELGDELGQIEESKNDLASKNIDKEQKAVYERYMQLKGEYNKIHELFELLDENKNTSLNDLRKCANEIKWDKVAGNTRNVTNEEVKEAMNVAKDARDEAKKKLEKFVNDYLLLDDESYKVATKGIYDAICDLVVVVKKFNVHFSDYKRKKNVLDFNDLEHFALEILKDDVTAITIQSQYKEVMIDEYQDINPLQETLLERLSNGHNMFMVGDIKQSIYGFRLADPELFGKKYKEIYQLSDEEVTGINPENELIVLPENFRSHNVITNFINMIFSQIMNEKLGDVDYSGDARLEPRAQEKIGDISPKIETLVYVEDNNNKSLEFEDVGSESLEFDGVEVVDDKATAQLKIIASKIKNLMVKYGPKPEDDEKTSMTRLHLKDIAILEQTRNLNLKLIDVFKQANIPVVVNDAGNYFQAVEINVIMSLLQIIDNPNQDIPLVAVFRSPIVGLGENDLAYIRACEKNGNYYIAVKKFMQDYKNVSKIQTNLNSEKIFNKLSNFFDSLEEWRKIATQNQLVKLIWKIYEDTGYLEYVGGMPMGAQRQANLHALYERAQMFENSSYIGLFSFIKYIEQLRKKNKDLDSPTIETGDDAVRLMTIHASKGQEFPIVFLLDATHKFRTTDLTKPLLIDNEYGISIPYLKQNHRVQLEVPRQAFIRNEYKKRLWAESLRVFYVALTRAKKRIYLVGAYKSTNSMLSAWKNGLDQNNLFIDENTRINANSFMDWVGMSIVRNPKFYQQKHNEFYLDLVNNESFSELKHMIKNFLNGLSDTDRELFRSDFNVKKFTKNDINNLIFEVDTENKLDEVITKTDEKKQNSKLDDILSFEQPASYFDDFKQIMMFKYPHVVATKTTAYQSVSELKRLFEDPDNLEENLIYLNENEKINLTERRIKNDELKTNRYVNDSFVTPKFLENDDSIKTTSIGSATHLVLQTINLHGIIDAKVIQDCIQKLVDEQSFDNSLATKIDVEKLLNLFKTPLGKLLTDKDNKIFREVPFSMLIPANKLYDKFSGGDERVLIHGIMDGYIITSTGEVILFDYKTDNVAATQTDILLNRYAGQLNLYARALANIENVQVNKIKKVIFSLALGREIVLNNRHTI